MAFVKNRVFIILCLLFCQCMYYSFSGSLAPHLKTVAVPLFKNQTAEFGVTEQLTDAVIAEFSRDNTLKIADAAVADVLIQGEIARISDQAGAFDQQETVEDYKVYITVNITCQDQVKKQVLWEERLTQWGIYEPTGGIQAREEGIAEAIDKISEEILNKTVAGW